MRAPLFAFILIVAGCGEDQAQLPANGAAPGEQGAPAAAGRIDRKRAGAMAPGAAFLDPDGEPAYFADFRGKPLLVNLWATWCAPCITEMPTLDALAEREQGLQVLAISQDIDGKEKVDAFFAERRFSALEPYLDPDLELMGAIGIASLPTTILYDGEGREVWRLMGIEDWTGPRAAALIDEASKASPAKAR